MEEKYEKGKIIVRVKDGQSANAHPIVEARVDILKTDSHTQQKQRTAKKDQCKPEFRGLTDSNGKLEYECDPGCYMVKGEAFGLPCSTDVVVEVEPACSSKAELTIPAEVTLVLYSKKPGCDPDPCLEVFEGTVILAELAHRLPLTTRIKYEWNINKGRFTDHPTLDTSKVYIDTTGQRGTLKVTAAVSELGSAHVAASEVTEVLPQPETKVGGGLTVSMKRTAAGVTTDLPLWVVIRESTKAISYDNYMHFMDWVLCGKVPPWEDIGDYEKTKFGDEKTGKKGKFNELKSQKYLPFIDVDAYRILKTATEAFLVVNCGVKLDNFPFTEEDREDLARRINVSADLSALWGKYLESVNGSSNRTLPYLALIKKNLPDVLINGAQIGKADLIEDCYGILRNKLTEPCLLELIWSYWHEEGMLVQTMNTISQRFQNKRGPAGGKNPLAELEIDPLRPLNNLFWGYIQDEQHRLSVVRRTYEYDHHYGFRLFGKSIPEMRLADSRSKFLEAFHNLLHLCTIFFQQDDDTTVVSDGFPVLNALKEIHLILSQGAHNQFGDLPCTARIEMLMQQWLLARPEFREFLPTRIMVAYPEPWMSRVDAMKKLQEWTDVSVLHFHNLGVFGEQILLAIRFGAWSDTNDPDQAKNWVRYWRAEIQGYIHSYRAVTGVDLTSEPVDYTMPSVHLRRRLASLQPTR